MTSTTARLATAVATGALALGVAACGGSTSTPSGTAPSVTAPTADAGMGAAADGAAPAAAKVSANTASEAEITAALAGAGVSNPQRWAEEVLEYRPYPADDPNLMKLRDNLAKYNPGQETTDKIVSALTP
jgi:hypothetical protein